MLRCTFRFPPFASFNLMDTVTHGIVGALIGKSFFAEDPGPGALVRGANLRARQAVWPLSPLPSAQFFRTLTSLPALWRTTVWP